jgi:tRNA A37 threonylcarbamoyladenosine synthetase subunit TsaC/SUA5/YrdC
MHSLKKKFSSLISVDEIFFEDTSKMLLSTVVDFSGLNPVVVRQGAGEWNP